MQLRWCGEVCSLYKIVSIFLAAGITADFDYFRLVLITFKTFDSQLFFQHYECLKTSGFVTVFLNSDKEVAISGLSSIQGRILEWLIVLTISKGISEL